jgi:hypothetical protein
MMKLSERNGGFAVPVFAALGSPVMMPNVLVPEFGASTSPVTVVVFACVTVDSEPEPLVGQV